MKNLSYILFLLLTQYSFGQKKELTKNIWTDGFISYWNFDTVNNTAILFSDSCSYFYEIKSTNDNVIKFENYPNHRIKYGADNESYSYKYRILKDTLFLSEYPFKLYKNLTSNPSFFPFDSVSIYMKDHHTTLTIYRNREFLINVHYIDKYYVKNDSLRGNRNLIGYYSGKLDSTQWTIFTSKLKDVLLSERYLAKDDYINSDCGSSKKRLILYIDKHTRCWDRLPTSLLTHLIDYYSNEILNLKFEPSFANGNKDYRKRISYEYLKEEYFLGHIHQKFHSKSTGKFYYHFITDKNDTLIMYSEKDIPVSTSIGVLTSYRNFDKYMNLIKLYFDNDIEYFEIEEYLLPSKVLPFFIPTPYDYQRHGYFPGRSKHKKKDLRKFIHSEEGIFLLKFSKDK